MPADVPAPWPVTFCITGLGAGGAERQLTHLALSLDRARWTPSVVSLLDGGMFESVLRDAGVPVLSLGGVPGRLPWSAVVRFAAHLRATRPRVVVAFLGHAILLARAAVALGAREIPIVDAPRSERPGRPGLLRLLRLTRRGSVFCVANSQGAAEALRRAGLARSPALVVIPNALLRPQTAPGPTDGQTTRRELGVAPDEFHWLAVGRLDPDKDHAGLWQACAALLQSGAAPFRLSVAGEGAARAALEAGLRAASLDRTVHLLGDRTDVSSLLASADGFVLSSLAEGMPNALMEALDAGCPVVATDVAGVRDILAPGLQDLLVPPGDPEALAAAMRRLASLPPADRRLRGEIGSAYVRTICNPERALAAWDACLEAVVTTRAAANRRKR